MQLIQRVFTRAHSLGMRHAYGLLLGVVLGVTVPAVAQPVQPASGASCTVSALNRNGPVAPDYSFELYNIPGNSGAFRARATCSDGTVGQTAVSFPELGSTVVFTGEIAWGKQDQTPLALGLRASSKRLTTDQTAQLNAIAVLENAATRDVTPRLEGTSYAVSNPLLASVSENGQIKVLPQFASGSSARVVATATNEGGVAASYMFVLGPRGSLSGKVTRADGLTPVAGAQVTVMRHQPMEQAGTAVTDSAGNFSLADVNAGAFSVSVIDPASGDRGQGRASIALEGDNAVADIKLNGQGQVAVTVTDAAGKAVANAEVTLAALGAVRDTRTLSTDNLGQIVFTQVAAGDFTVSTRDPVSLLVGTAVGNLPVGGVLPVLLKLQPVGTVEGTVFGADGAMPQEGVQVRILSRERGIVSQTVTGPDGRFSFNPLPLTDGPFTLDAFVDGRLRARVPDVVISNPNQSVTRNVQFTAVGTVRGVVADINGKPFDEVTVTLQSLEGLRQSFSARAGASGAFMLQGIPVGNYRLTASTKDGRNGSALGNMPTDGAEMLSNIQLAASGVVGTVFQRDGVTPAGAGVEVFLLRHPAESDLALTLEAGGRSVLASGATNAQGQYSFAIDTPDLYVVQAQQADNRGRTQLALTALQPGKPETANVAFLGKGGVSGMVRDSSGQPQAGIPVKVKSVGAFTNTWLTTTDANGHYELSGIFVGDIVVSAENAASKLGGSANGRMIAEGNSLSLDINLSATATLRGRVLRGDNVGAAVAPLLVQLYGVNPFTPAKTATVAEGNQYEFNLVPLGPVRVVVTETASGDKGMANTVLTTANEVRAADVRLIGQGAVKVSVVDGDNKPVASAKVMVRSLSAFGGESEQITDDNGVVLFQPVFNGDYTVSASKPAQFGQLSGTAQGTLLHGQTAEITVVLRNRPVGKISGIVYEADGVTPRPRIALALTPAPGVNAYQAETDINGRYVLENIEGGNDYTLSARRADLGQNDRVRARAMGLQITDNGQVLNKNLQLIGAGTVRGKVTLPDGNPAAGIEIVFDNPDPQFGRNPQSDGTYRTTTDSGGNFALQDMPVGNFALRAQKREAGLRAEASSRVKFDQDVVTVDLALVDNSVPMPFTLRDANAMPFDIAGDGSVTSGKNNVFAGQAPDAGGMRLEIVSAGVPVPFRNGDGSIGRLSHQGQEIEVDEVNGSGLNVTRRIYVPKDGYFARYLEVLENRGDKPVTVDVRLVSHHSQSNSNPRIVDSSDGDNVLSILDPANRDRWLVVDDQQDIDPFKSNSIPATGHVFDGEGAAHQTALADYQLVGQTGKLQLQWDGITLQPGEKTILMHFAFNQIDRYRAREAALRLAQLPPEALAGLEADERAAIGNFKVPTDGVSQVAALPALGQGKIEGTVLSGDGVTPVAAAKVRLRSKLPLFGREYTTVSDANGHYAFSALLDGSANANPLPLYAFELDALHPNTGAVSADGIGDFAAGTGKVAKDPIFNGTANLRGTVRRPGGTLVADSEVWVTLDAAAPYRLRSGADGSFLFTGLPPRDYVVAASKRHPQQSSDYCCGIEGDVAAAAIGGGTTVADLVLEQVGSVTGMVLAANGVPVVGARVQLEDRLGRQARAAVSDTAGRYRFVDVKLGKIRLYASDDVSKASAMAGTEVSADNETVQDLKLKGFGTVNVQVNFARGAAAPDALITYQGNKVKVDSAGRASFSLQVGSYDFVAMHPANPDEEALYGWRKAELLNNGDALDLTLTLAPAGGIKGSVVRPDGSTLAGGFPYSVRLLNGAYNRVRNGRTDAVGNFQVDGLPLGLYILTAYDPELNRFADTEVTVASDGVDSEVALRLEDNRIALPATLVDANRFVYDVQQDGRLAAGSNAYLGAAALEVNGQPFKGDTSAGLSLAKRQFAISQKAALAGLQVSRKIFAPKGGYFARYLEVFENPAAAPVSVQVALRTGYRDAQLIASSSKAATVSAADHWVVLDDDTDGDILLGARQPPTAHVFGQPGAASRADTVQLASDAEGRTQFAQAWQTLTVPAGGKAVLMHFVVQQVNRSGALAAAERLTQLPPEAIDGLTPSEIASIVNFSVPADGVSTLASLPALTAGVKGRVVEGDNVTAVNSAHVTVQSSHPLFNRVWGMVADPECELAGTPLRSLVARTQPDPQNDALSVTGLYTVQGQLTDSDSVPLPVGYPLRLVVQEAQGCFGQYSGHPFTGLQGEAQVINASARAAQDLRFDSGILSGTVNGPAGLGITHGELWRSTDDRSDPKHKWVPIAADGSYVYPGLPTGSYDILAAVPHPQGGELRGERLHAVVTAGRTTITDIPLQAAGAMVGTVLTANGEASVGSTVELVGDAAGQQYDACAPCDVRYEANVGRRRVHLTAVTDSLGRYAFSAVPAGALTVVVTDRVSGAKRSMEINVGEGQQLVQNITLVALGSVRLSLSKASGAAAPDANVYLWAAAAGAEILVGRTDPAGKLTVANVPLGEYRLRIADPRYPGSSKLQRIATGSMGANGEVQDQALTLLSVAGLRVSAQDGDNGNTPLTGVDVTVDGEWRGQIGADGSLLVPALSEGEVEISVRKLLEGSPASLTVHPMISVADDNAVRDLPLSLKRSYGSINIITTNKDDNNVPVANAEILLSAGGAPLERIGQTDGSGKLFHAGVPMGSYRLVARAQFDGVPQEASLAAEVTSQNIGQTQTVAAVFERSLLKRVVLGFDGERHLYAVPLNVADVLAVGLKGAAIDATPAADMLAVSVLDRLGATVAAGYARGPEGSYEQRSTRGELTNVSGTANANYVIAVSPYNSDARNLGGYELGATINGAQVSLKPFQGGGTVSGTLLRADRVSTVANTVVRLRTAGSYGLHVQTTTDADGKFVFANVPLESFTLRALNIGTEIATASGVVRSAGETVVANIVQPSVTIFNVKVRNADGTPYVGAQLRYDNFAGKSGLLVLNAAAEGTLVYTGDQAVRFEAVKPSNSLISSAKTLPAADGRTIELVLTLGAVQISGKVVDATGKGLPYARLRVQFADDAMHTLYNTTTNEVGEFSLPEMGAGRELLLFAQGSSSWNNPAGMVRVTGAPGQVMTNVLVVVPATMTIAGQVMLSTGRPLAGESVSVSWNNPFSYEAGNRSVWTDSEGKFTLPGVPAGTPVTIAASFENQYGEGSSNRINGSMTVTTPASGSQAELPPLVLQLGGVVSARLKTPDGSAVPWGQCLFAIKAGVINGTRRLSCDTAVEYAGLPDGRVDVSIGPEGAAPYGTVTVSAQQNLEVAADVMLSKITGTVRYTNGSAADPATVFVQDVAGELLFAERGADGQFSVYGTRPGAFSITAQDQDGLTSTAQGNMADPGRVLTLDAVLPPYGSVTGVVYDPSGKPVVDAAVYVRTPTQESELSGYTDATGRYTISKVALGSFRVSASDAESGSAATVSGLLAADGATAEADLRLPEAGSVSGRVLTSGLTPVANSQVTLRYAETGHTFGDTANSVSTDATGTFRFSKVAPGPFLLFATGNRGDGIATGSVLPAANTAVDVKLGNGARLPTRLTGADQVFYEIDQNTMLYAGSPSYGQFYRDYYGLSVNGIPFGAGELGNVIETGRELAFGPYMHAGLQVSRRIYVPTTGGFVRMIESIGNPSAAPIDAVVRISGLSQAGEAMLTMHKIDADSGYVVYSIPDYSLGGRGAMFTVFNGASGGLAPSTLNFSGGSSSFNYEWKIRVPAGQTVSFMHFAGAVEMNDANQASGRAKALSNGSDGNMLHGMTAADKAAVRNFNLNP